MPTTKNLCAQISLELHQKISEAREESGLTTAQYITNLVLEYYEMKENGGNVAMTNNKSRTLAFQIDENLFQRIKAHLERETARTGRKLTQREFVLGLIEEALNEAERQAGVSPCEAHPEGSDTQPQEAVSTKESGAGSGPSPGERMKQRQIKARESAVHDDPRPHDKVTEEGSRRADEGGDLDGVHGAPSFTARGRAWASGPLGRPSARAQAAPPGRPCPP